jgi:NADPH:quinone reductase-like Zn-dependent oxidoreductase
LTLSHEAAAGLPLAGLTSWQMLVEVARVKADDRVLVNAGAGGAGHLAIQIAKARGAHVTATARCEKHPLLRRLGADDVLDYTAADPAETIRDMDIVIEFVGGKTCLRLLKCLRKDGLLVSAQAAWAPTLQEEAARLGVRASWFLVEPDGTGLERLAGLVEAGKLMVHVDRSFPLAEVRAAQEYVATRRATGKVVLTI